MAKKAAARPYHAPFCPRRRRIVRGLLENSRDCICRTVICKTRTGQQLFPLLGERIKGEGERNPQISSASIKAIRVNS
jgi:hypothetical protein